MDPGISQHHTIKSKTNYINRIEAGIAKLNTTQKITNQLNRIEARFSKLTNQQTNNRLNRIEAYITQSDTINKLLNPLTKSSSNSSSSQPWVRSTNQSSSITDFNVSTTSPTTMVHSWDEPSSLPLDRPQSGFTAPVNSSSSYRHSKERIMLAHKIASGIEWLLLISYNRSVCFHPHVIM